MYIMSMYTNVTSIASMAKRSGDYRFYGSAIRGIA
jgi:hypothetical protein